MSVAGDVAYNIPNTFNRSFLRNPHKFRKFSFYLPLKRHLSIKMPSLFVFLCLQHSYLHRPSLPSILHTVSVETWKTFHWGCLSHTLNTCNTTKVARCIYCSICFFVFFYFFIVVLFFLQGRGVGGHIPNTTPYVC